MTYAIWDGIGWYVRLVRGALVHLALNVLALRVTADSNNALMPNHKGFSILPHCIQIHARQ